MYTPEATTRTLGSSRREYSETSTIFEGFSPQFRIIFPPAIVFVDYAVSIQKAREHSHSEIENASYGIREKEDSEHELSDFFNKTKFESLRAEYVFEKEDEVNSFISSNSHLLKTLQEAPSEIRKVFDVDVQLVLEVLDDPEENTKELFIVIRSQLDAEDGRTRLNFLIDDWFIDQLDEVDGKLNITEEQV